MIKNKCVAMLLAGGQGSRLYSLTKNIAKPAVPFGGKYRIIDFPLSNCVNSGITTVGVLTQYEPHELHRYIGNGQPWDLDRLNGGVFMLPPYQRGAGSEWYTGTANAIFQNISFIDSFDPEYVLVLSGDHIYKMDYNEMISFHQEKNAGCTIAVLDVPLDEAPRFGIMSVDDEMNVTAFEEKPKQPKSTLASMGIYVFDWQLLRKYLISDASDANSKNDFGKNIIPAMLSNGEKLVTYRFDGYWKDVGTIESLWEANMDLLSDSLDLRDDSWKVYARPPGSPPHYASENAVISHSIISEGCLIDGTVEQSVLFADVSVAKDALVRYSVVMPGVTIGEGAVVEYSIVAEGASIKAGAHVGGGPSGSDSWGVAVIANGVTVGEGASVAAAEMADSDVYAEGRSAK